MTVAIVDRLEISALLFASFHFTAYPKAGSSVACAFEGLDNVYLEACKQILRQNNSEAEQENT